MNIILNYENDSYIYNLAYVRALLIVKRIEKLDISYDEKIEVKKEVLHYLKNHE